MNIAWITGGGSGIGRAIALKLAQEGVQVAVTSRSHSDIDTLVREPLAQGRIHSFPGDVVDRQEMVRLAESIEQTVGPLDLLVPAAGIFLPFGLAEFSAEKIEAMFQVNVVGVANVIEAVLPRFITRNSGRLAVVTSFSQYRGLGRTPGYGSTKAALLSMCETLRLQTRDTGITVQVIVPGFVHTRMTENAPFDLPGILSAEEAANQSVAGLRTDTFEIMVPLDIVGKVRAARAMDPEDYFEMAARTPLFGGTAD